MTVTLSVYPTATEFVPAEIDGADWSQVGPLYDALLGRTLKCKGCLEQLMLDRSELDAAVGEARASLYIQMTRHTDDEDIKAAFLKFVEEMDPRIKDVSFKLDRMIVQCPHVDDMDTDRYSVLIRALEADVQLFREENIALEVDETKLADIMAAMRQRAASREREDVGSAMAAGARFAE